MDADGLAERGLAGFETNARLEPLTVAINEAHKGNGDVRKPVRQACHDVVEAFSGAGCRGRRSTRVR